MPSYRFYSQGIDLVIQGRYSIHQHNRLPLDSYMNETEEFKWDDIIENGEKNKYDFHLITKGATRVELRYETQKGNCFS